MISIYIYKTSITVVAGKQIFRNKCESKPMGLTKDLCFSSEFDKGGSSLLPLTLAVHKVITSFPVTFLAHAQKDLPSQRPVFDF